MTNTLRLTRAITVAMVMGAALVAGTASSSFAAKENPANDCLIGIQNSDEETLANGTVECTDGDACDSDGATNGSCVFRIRGFLNLPGVTGCENRPLKKFKFKVKGEQNLFQISPVDPDTVQSVIGAFVDFTVPLKKKGKKPGLRKINASAKGNVKPTKKNSDTDKVGFKCLVCGSESCVPPTTTTTTTSSTTTTTIPCGNGTIDAGETCDPEAVPNGCSGGTPYCNTSTCTSCQASCTDMAFKVGSPTTYCGFPGASDPAFPPFTGQLQDDMAANVSDLGAGCLYIGGGQAIVVPPGPVPDSSELYLAVDDCSQNNVNLSAAEGTSLANCSEGPAATLHCTNGHPGTDGNGACASDGDCADLCQGGSCINGSPGTGEGNCTEASQCGASVSVCQPDPSCYFGAPLPIANSVTSTCVLNVIKDGVSGTADIAAGSATINLPLKSWVYLTGITYDPNPSDSTDIPCPLCTGGVCGAGPRKDLPCSTANALGTTHDCPPDPYLFLAPLDVSLNPLTTGIATLSNATGIFCNGQNTAGAFGVTTARTIIESGVPASGGLDVTYKDATLGSAFCIPITGNLLIDGAADLPGPGAVGLSGQVRLR
jgi:hypothetical protein